MCKNFLDKKLYELELKILFNYMLYILGNKGINSGKTWLIMW